MGVSPKPPAMKQLVPLLIIGCLALTNAENAFSKFSGVEFQKNLDNLRAKFLAKDNSSEEKAIANMEEMTDRAGIDSKTEIDLEAKTANTMEEKGTDKQEETETKKKGMDEKNVNDLEKNGNSFKKKAVN